MIGVSNALTSDFFELELATLLFWGANAAWVMVVLHGMIVHRSLAAAYLFAVMWALTLCLHIAVPLLTTTELTLVDSFFLLAVILPGAQAIFDVIGVIGTVFGWGNSQNGG